MHVPDTYIRIWHILCLHIQFDPSVTAHSAADVRFSVSVTLLLLVTKSGLVPYLVLVKDCTYYLPMSLLYAAAAALDLAVYDAGLDSRPR